MKTILLYTQKAREDLSELDDKTRDRIILKLEFFCFKSSPIQHSKVLHGDFKGFRRFRVGDYRIVFKIGNDGKLTIVTIVRIKHRRDIYE